MVMEDEEIDATGNMIPMALIMFGIILGGAGLYFGLTANQRVSSIDASIDASTTNSDQITESIDYYDSQIAELKKEVSELSKTMNRLRVYSSQGEQAVKKLANEVNANREQLIKTAEALNALQTSQIRRKTQPQPSKPPSQTSSRTVDNRSEEPANVSSSNGTYVIEPGDNFSKIAAKFDVSVQAIIDANPYADPRRLAIGQTIQIPAR